MPPAGNEPIPAPGSTESTTFTRPTSGQIQHVSYDEFQRLPGVVVSGPTTQSSVPTMAAQPVPPSPQPSTVQQAQWAPSR